jgi:electron transfer flavoprotein alpha subunit
MAVVLARAGELPPDAGEAISEAAGAVLVVGDGAARAATAAAATPPTAPPAAGPPTAGPPATGPSPAGPPATGPSPADPPATGAPAVGQRAADLPATGAAAAVAGTVWWCDTGPGLRPAELAARLAPVLADVRLVILPGTPDGRDLAPRLAAELGRPLLSRAARAEATATGVRAELCRLDGQIVVPAEVTGPAVATLEPGTGVLTPASGPATVRELALPRPARAGPDPDVLAVLDAEPGTAALADAPAVLAGGAGLAAGLDDAAAQQAFALLTDVAAALGAVAGATRVATDAGWAEHDRQIGTTGVTIAPRSYVAFGISGAAQHVGGIGTPQHVVSVNTDPHCPMTAMSGLGIVADARATLAELAARLGVAVPEPLRGGPPASGGAQHEEVRDASRPA